MQNFKIIPLLATSLRSSRSRQFYLFLIGILFIYLFQIFNVYFFFFFFFFLLFNPRWKKLGIDHEKLATIRCEIKFQGKHYPTLSNRFVIFFNVVLIFILFYHLSINNFKIRHRSQKICHYKMRNKIYGKPLSHFQLLLCNFFKCNFDIEWNLLYYLSINNY